MGALRLLLAGAALAIGAAGPARAAAADEEALAEAIQTLAAGYEYRGQIYDAEVVNGVAFEPRQGLLLISIDDAEETAPLTLMIPLRTVAIDPVLGRFRDTGKPAIVMSCRPACIESVPGRLEEAMRRLSAGSGAAGSLKPREQYALGCRPELCESMQNVLDELVAMDE